MNPLTHHGAQDYDSVEEEAAAALVEARKALPTFDALREILPHAEHRLLSDCRKHFNSGRIFGETASYDLETFRLRVQREIDRETVHGAESVEVASYGGEPVLETRQVVRLTTAGQALQRSWTPVAIVLARLDRIKARIKADAEIARLRAAEE